ncbi:MAG: hypothetical protein KDC84_01080 [Crocinitomicaceae bacterium]|nr:hypothetical protein [Crocinitomicaceae bacterium]
MDSSSSAGSLSDYFKIILSGIAIASPILWQVRKFRIQQRDIEIQRINDFKEKERAEIIAKLREAAAGYQVHIARYSELLRFLHLKLTFENGSIDQSDKREREKVFFMVFEPLRLEMDEKARMVGENGATILMHLSHIFNQDKTKKIVKLIEETTHYLEDTLLQDIDSKKVRQFGANVGNAIKELLKEDDEKRSNS